MSFTTTKGTNEGAPSSNHANLNEKSGDGEASGCASTQDNDANAAACSSSQQQSSNSSSPTTNNGAVDVDQTTDNKSPKKKKRPPVSLAVAADVPQAEIPENASQSNHARGGAVAQHLQSLLSHISSNERIIASLKSELNHEESTASSGRAAAAAAAAAATEEVSESKKEGCTKSNEDSEAKPPPSSGGNDIQNAAEESSPQQQHPKEFLLRRVMHAIDNYLHPPSKLLPHLHFASPHRHHHQGHRLGSSRLHASSVEQSNHACGLDCLPDCQLKQPQQQQQQQQTNDKTHHKRPSVSLRSSSRRLSAMSASISSTVSSAIASNFHTTSHSRTNNNDNHPTTTSSSKSTQPETTEQPQPKPFFPFNPFHMGLGSSSQSQSQTKRSSARFFRGPLLYGTSDHEEHDAVITTAVHVCNLYKSGQDVTRQQYTGRNDESDGDVESSAIVEDDIDAGGEDLSHGFREDECHKGKDAFDCRARHALSSLGFEFRLDMCQNCRGENNPTEGKRSCKSDGSGESRCSDCVTRLYHTQSNTAVTGENRRTYIADGTMYDAIANLCQSAAQEIIAERCNLVWVTVCDGKGGGLRVVRQQSSREQHPPPQNNNDSSMQSSSSNKSRSNSIEEWPRDECGNIIVREPIRALVGRRLSNDDDDEVDTKLRPQDTFLVATGKGKVRAGIFSRHHLMTTGLEPSTALPLLCSARDRGMNCVVIDPNARGDRHGMDTFEVSIRSLFELQSDLLDEAEGRDDTSVEEGSSRAIIPADVDGSIYVLAHSAAGGQLVRYLLDQQKGSPLLSRLRCITFTDSTHSIQWLKSHPHISSLIQSSNALYVRSANPMRDDDWENAMPGDECPRDHFWSHRFGDIKTVWAGTTEHSLSNWTAHKPIWDHFDKIRQQTKPTTTKDYEKENSSSADERNTVSVGNKSKNSSGAVEKKSNNGEPEASEEPTNKECVHHVIGPRPVVI